MGLGNERLFAGSGSLDQDGCHAHIWLKPFKNLLLWNQRTSDFGAWYAASGTKFLSPRGCLSLPWGYIYACIKSLKVLSPRGCLPRGYVHV